MRRHYPLTSLILLVSALSTTAIADVLSRKNAKANKLFEKEKYDEAAKLYLDTQLELPKSKELCYNLGSANYKMKKYEKAIEHYQKAAQSDAPNLEQVIRYNLGNSLYKLGEYEIGQGKQEGLERFKQAIENYKRALDLNPDDQDAKYNLEFVRRKLKEMAKRQNQQPKQQQQQRKQQQRQNQEQQQQKQEQQNPDSTRQQEKKPRPKPGEMSEEEAKRLLDAFKDTEKDARKKQSMRARARAGVAKDW